MSSGAAILLMQHMWKPRRASQSLAREAGVERLAHISGIGTDSGSSSSYIRARGRGEEDVQRTFPNAALIRPAVMFGPDDAFLTTLVKLVRLLPVYPLFGRGHTKLQPVYVEDVAEATTRLMEGAGATVDHRYEFGGPRVYAYEELVRTLTVQTGARTKIVPTDALCIVACPRLVR